MNNCTNMRQVAYDLNEQQDIDPEILEDMLEDWRLIEEEFAYGGSKFEDFYEMNSKDHLYKEMKRFTHEEFVREYRRELIIIRNDWVFRKNNIGGFSHLKTSERSMTTYNYKQPDYAECRDFVIKNKAGEGKFAQFFMRIKIALTRSEYFERLFPTIKEQKPGIDLYAPMVIFQVLVIIIGMSVEGSFIF